jgi:hypothetical protein
MLTRKCKHTNRLCAYLYPLISAAIILIGNLTPIQVFARNTAPLFFSEIPLTDPGTVELPSAINGRLNSGYVLHNEINVVEGSGVTVNAGQDQNLQAGAIQASLAGTMTGAGSGNNNSVNLVVIFGESNASGEAPNSDASSADLLVKTNTKIWNDNNNTFESMQVGVNNQIQQGFNPTNVHGFEIGLANAVDAGQLTQPTYLVKLGSPGSKISQWLNGGTPQNSQMGWGVVQTRMNAAINYLNSHNIPFVITVWESIGINDYNAGTSNTTFTNQMVQFRTDFRNLYGASIPFLTTLFFASHPYDPVIQSISDNDPQHTSQAIYTDDAPRQPDGAHWTYDGYKIIAGRMVADMPPVGGATITTTTWTIVSGPGGGNISALNNLNTSITGLQAGTYVFRLSASQNGNTVASDDVTIVVPAIVANQPPIANAGVDQNISLPTNSVTLNGSGSSDPDGTISSFLWTKISGSSQLTMVSNTSASTVVNNLTSGVYSFQLTVTDNSGAIALDTIKVIVNAAPANQPPVANAGADITITLPTNLVNLNGSASNDPDGTISSYAWSQVSGPAQALIMTASNPASAVGGLQQGVYVFSLTVTDNSGATATDNLTVTVNGVPNLPPVANAGISQSITLPANSLTLDGSLSSDPDGSIAAYSWAQVSGPSAAAIAGGSSSKPTASGLVAGQYIFQLTVTDNKGATATSSVKITVSNSGVQPPIANAGADQAITLPTNTVIIDASASSASSGNIVSYVWTEKSGPSTVSLSNTAINTVNNLQAGVYTFKLTVTDNNGATGTDSVNITVIPVVNRAPVADAGASVSLTLPNNSTSLDGSKSYDPDGTIISYQWTRISGPNMPATMGANAAVVNLGGLVAGTYSYQLTVTDNNGASSSGQVKVIVAAGPNIPPIANAGTNQSITAPANSVTLNGSASSDPDGTIVSYNWVTVSGPGSITISNSNTSTPTVVGLQPGGYVFELTVTDNKGATAKDQVDVTVLPQSLSPNQPPVANAGNNQTITAPLSSVSLNGSSSFDPDGTISGYGWKQISGPSASSITAGNTSTATASQLIVGQYIFELTVTDNNGVKNTDQVTVTVNPASGKVNIPPVADAGSNDTLELPNNSYTLNASGSKDADGTIASYQWQQISGPNTVKSSNMNVPQVAISDFQAGEYEFQVVVTDNEGATSTAMMKLTVEAASGITDRFIVYPNPAHDVTTAKITSSVTGKVKIVVYDMNGRLVLTTEAEKTDDVVIKTVNVSTLASGMYTVQIVIGNKKTMVTKFIKN